MLYTSANNEANRGQINVGNGLKRVYPVALLEEEDHYLVRIPDMDVLTQGEDLADAILMARDAIELMGITLEDQGKPLPEPSEKSGIKLQEGEFLTLVDVDFAAYRMKLDARAVRKNCTIPNWLNERAESAGLNFSRVLQEALINKLWSDRHGR